MTATATAQPDTANKFLELVVDGDNYSTDDVQPITADGGQFVIMPTLSAGHYRFYAILFRLVDSNLKDVSHVYYDYTVGE